MKTIENRKAILSKSSVAKIQEIEKLNRLLSLLDFINESENGCGRIKIPEFGELIVSPNGDIEFLASKALSKDLEMIRKNNSNAFIKKEICKILGVEPNE